MNMHHFPTRNANITYNNVYYKHIVIKKIYDALKSGGKQKYIKAEKSQTYAGRSVNPQSHFFL